MVQAMDPRGPRASLEGTAPLSKLPTTVREYVDASVDNPRLARNSQNYVSDMIDHYGVEQVFEGIFGLDDQIEQIVLFFHAHNTSLERRLLLFVGPQGAGKSYTVDKIKFHLDRYSHTDEGALWAVAGCPFHQHPFDLIPHAERPAFKQSHGIRWYPEAIPCPVCEVNIQKHGSWENLPIERIHISTAAKTGLAKHTPTDLRREDITNFIGNINFSKLKKIGSTYDPDSFDFEGKMIWANRGILDWTEIFKSRRQLLGLLLELIQSKRIDMTNFPTVHVDEIVIGHTNFPEYNVFINEDIMEPLRGRIYKIEFPYGLSVENEMKIYRKFIQRTDHLKKTEKHCSDDTLRFLCEFAVRTREASEGLQGLSPRFFQDVLSRAYTKAERCIDVTNIHESIQKMFSHKSLKDFDAETTGEMLEKCKEEFINGRIKIFIEKVIPKHFKDYGQNLYKNYLAAAEKRVTGAKMSATETKLLDYVEELLVAKGKISASGRSSFQTVLMERKAELETMSYDQNEQLGETINEIVFNNVKNFLRLSSKTKKLDKQTKEIRDILLDCLRKDHDYCEDCATALFDVIGEYI